MEFSNALGSLMLFIFQADAASKSYGESLMCKNV